MARRCSAPRPPRPSPPSTLKTGLPGRADADHPRGRDETADHVVRVFAGAAESRAEQVGGFRPGDRAVMEYNVTVVDEASGRPFTFRGVLIAELEGDLLRPTTKYDDVATIRGLLGGEATPTAGTPATAAEATPVEPALTQQRPRASAWAAFALRLLSPPDAVTES